MYPSNLYTRVRRFATFRPSSCHFIRKLTSVPTRQSFANIRTNTNTHTHTLNTQAPWTFDPMYNRWLDCALVFISFRSRVICTTTKKTAHAMLLMFITHIHTHSHPLTQTHTFAATWVRFHHLRLPPPPIPLPYVLSLALLALALELLENK